MLGGGWTASDLAEYYRQTEAHALLTTISVAKPSVGVTTQAPVSADPGDPGPPAAAVQQDEPGSPAVPAGKPGSPFSEGDKPPGKPGNPFAAGAPENPFAAIRQEFEAAGMVGDAASEPAGGEEAADE